MFINKLMKICKMEVQMKKRNFMEYIFLLAVIVFLFQVVCISAYAKEQSIVLNSNIYEFDENNSFMITNASVTDGLISDVGTLEITGDITLGNKKMGMNPSYVVDGNEAKISYSVKQSVGDWYFTDVKDKTIDDIELENKILKGSIIVQTSLNGVDWVIVKEYSDVFGKNTEVLKEIYVANDIQLQNGCFYRIIVVYEQERIVEQKKIGPIKKDKKECRRIAEVYDFFAESKDKGQISSPNVSPKKIYGEENGVSTAVNTGEDGYCLSKGTNILESDDPQFGWALGYFTINGYTDVVKDDGGNDVFLKNVGDQVTLWFTLEKDINDLLGDGRLSISEDEDGEDLDFQIKKSNFKRGALIISHLDSENRSDKPIIYTDYLAANVSTGANTKVTLFEEGDYEVALDYEIKNKSRKIGSVAIAPEYTNYKIYFKFSIRNGNCMAYPFDINLGNELRDGDICEEGFTIKLAGSRYNDVTMKYEAIVGEDGQKKFDTRKNMVAKEGDSYTDEGVYIFSANNPYTNVTTTKTVYVGTDPYLKALSKTGRSLSDINDKIQQGYLIEEDGSIIVPKIEVPEPELEQEIEPEQTEENSVIAEVDSKADAGIVEYASKGENGDNEIRIEDSPKHEYKRISLIVPTSVGLVVILGIIYIVFKNKKKVLDIPKDPEEDLQ
mgnify:CR=1 FL=1